MAVCFWYLVNSAVTCPVYVCNVLAYTGQVTFYKVREKHGHVYLVWLYILVKFTAYKMIANFCL